MFRRKCHITFIFSSLELICFHHIFCNSFISTDPVEDEDGDFKEKEFRDHRYYSEIEKLRVTWNTERRCYMDSGAVKG